MEAMIICLAVIHDVAGVINSHRPRACCLQVNAVLVTNSNDGCLDPAAAGVILDRIAMPEAREIKLPAKQTCCFW